MSAPQRRHARISGPRLWCPGGCGNWVEHIGCEGDDGAVLVVLGRETFWFCAVACASMCLNELHQAVNERGREPYFMHLNTLSEN